MEGLELLNDQHSPARSEVFVGARVKNCHQTHEMRGCEGTVREIGDDIIHIRYDTSRCQRPDDATLPVAWDDFDSYWEVLSTPHAPAPGAGDGRTRQSVPRRHTEYTATSSPTVARPSVAKRSRTSQAADPASPQSSRRDSTLRLGNWVERETALRLLVRLDAPTRDSIRKNDATPHAWLGVMREEAWDPSTLHIGGWCHKYEYQGWVYDAYSGLALANRDGAYAGDQMRRLPATRHDGGVVELTLTNRELRYRVDGEDQGVVFTLPADGGRIALAMFAHDGAQPIVEATQIVHGHGLTSLYTLRPLHAPGGYFVDQRVWALIDHEHATKPIHYGQSGVVQGPGKTNRAQVNVVFDSHGTKMSWDMQPDWISSTEPQPNEVQGSPEEHARAPEDVVIDDSSSDDSDEEETPQVEDAPPQAPAPAPPQEIDWQETDGRAGNLSEDELRIYSDLWTQSGL